MIWINVNTRTDGNDMRLVSPMKSIPTIELTIPFNVSTTPRTVKRSQPRMLTTARTSESVSETTKEFRVADQKSM
jgi:hypothetical protein